MGVIIVSLLVASLGLPVLLRGLLMPPEHDQQSAEDAARVKAAEAAIARIEEVQHELAEGRADADLYVSAAARIMDGYRERIESRVGTREENAEMRRGEAIERRLRIAALKAERSQDLDELLEVIDSNFLGWARDGSRAIMGNPDAVNALAHTSDRSP